MNIFTKLKDSIDSIEKSLRIRQNKKLGRRCFSCHSNNVQPIIFGYGASGGSEEYHCNDCQKDYVKETKFYLKEN